MMRIFRGWTGQKNTPNTPPTAPASASLVNSTTKTQEIAKANTITNTDNLIKKIEEQILTLDYEIIVLYEEATALAKQKKEQEALYKLKQKINKEKERIDLNNKLQNLKKMKNKLTRKPFRSVSNILEAPLDPNVNEEAKRRVNALMGSQGVKGGKSRRNKRSHTYNKTQKKNKK